MNTLNVALVKHTSIAKTALQLRAETFNAFDRVQFNVPVTAATSSDAVSPARPMRRGRYGSLFA